ncbi:MAG: endonuclease/exonuclease/phosphatase family protein [Oscillospiraceae bacterium]|jgi:endonuclease/exonuclease/phosphatase family metal-dependent hydrolase|nr:endonuclease/exonuclease/phosphatase family protein [Oscillospiraceae bacterium]
MFDFLKPLIAFLTSLLALTSSGAMALLPPPAAPPAPRISAQTQEITVMSFNVYNAGSGDKSPEKRLDGVIAAIRSEMPDSFGLQEATEFWRFKLWWALRKEYTMVESRGAVFGLAEADPIFYRKDKYKVLDSGHFWLSDRPNISSIGWDAMYARTAVYAVLEDKQTGFVYVHYNTHFDHVGDLARTNSAALVAESINRQGLPAVLTGDLNALPSSKAYSYLKQGGLKDARLLAAAADKGRTFHGYTGTDPKTGDPVDYILANGYLRSVRRYHILRDKYNGNYPSDHFAVAATLTLAGKK